MFEDLKKLLKAEDVDTRRDAALSLRALPPGSTQGEAIALLIEALEDPSWRVRKTAVDSLMEGYPVESYVGGLLGLLYLEDNAGARNSAIETLVRLGSRVTEHLLEAFKTENHDVRKFLIDVIGEIGDRRSIPLLISALKDKDENVKASAVEHLGSMKEPSVVDALLEILGENDLWTAYPAVEALGRIGDARAKGALLRALEIKSLREPALRALGRLGGAELLDHVVPHVLDRSKAVQHEAFSALERLYKKGATEAQVVAALNKHLGEEGVHKLLQYAGNHRPEVRVSAIMLLGMLRDESSLEPLLQIALDDQYTEEVYRALLYIGKGKPMSLLRLMEDQSSILLRFLCRVMADVAAPEYFEVMVELLENEDGHVRTQAARALANIGDLRAVEPLKRRLTDMYEDVQEGAVQALKTLKAGLTVQDLAELLRHQKPGMRRNAVHLLGALGTPDSVAAIDFALKDDSPLVRKAAVRSLSVIHSEEAVRLLIMTLTDEDPQIRLMTALTLGETGKERFYQPLVLLLSDPDDMVRVGACKALGKLGQRKAVVAMAKLKNDPSGFVVTAAVDAAGKLGGPEARAFLYEMLGSADGEIRRTSLLALSGMEGAEGKIMEYLSHPDWATRAAAVEALRRFKGEWVEAELDRLYDKEPDPVVRRAIKETRHA